MMMKFYKLYYETKSANRTTAKLAIYHKSLEDIMYY